MEWRDLAAHRTVGLALLLVGLAACEVPTPPAGSGGVDAEAGSNGRGVVVVSTGYQSSSVSLLGLDGTVLSPQFVSSASASTGLSAPLSGDVVLPTATAAGDDVVLVDRFLTSVLTFVDIKTARVRGQLGVGTGFASNPRDYLPVSETEAWVSRYEQNRNPGRVPFDQGNDLLIIDPKALAITGRVGLESAVAGTGFLPRTDRMVRVGGRAIVVLGVYDTTFADAGPARVLAIDLAERRIVSVLVLDGAYGCAALAMAPDGNHVALGCSGRFVDPNFMVKESAIVLVRVDEQLVEEKRFSSATLGAGPVAYSLDFEDSEHVLLTTFGTMHADAEHPPRDSLRELDLGSGEAHELLQSVEGWPFTLGDIRCMAAAATCFVADAKHDGGVVHRFVATGQGLVLAGSTHPDSDIGLPPRYLGLF